MRYGISIIGSKQDNLGIVACITSKSATDAAAKLGLKTKQYGPQPSWITARHDSVNFDELPEITSGHQLTNCIATARSRFRRRKK